MQFRFIMPPPETTAGVPRCRYARALSLCAQASRTLPRCAINKLYHNSAIVKLILTRNLSHRCRTQEIQERTVLAKRHDIAEADGASVRRCSACW